MTIVEDLAHSAIRPDVPEAWRLGRFFVPKGRYTDPEFLQLEIERMFPRTWIPACRLEEIPQTGDYVEFNLVGESILVLRDSDHIRAFFNSCRHRGTRLARGRGRVGNLRCPFHAWQYGLDGQSQYVHDRSDFPDLTNQYLCLREPQVDTWGGWVFINLDRQAEPLEEYLSPLPQRLAVLHIDDMSYLWHKTFTLPCNWKVALEAFSESYHVPGTHPQLLRVLDTSLRPASVRELRGDPSHAPSHVVGRHASRFIVEPRDPTRLRHADTQTLKAITEYQLRELRALHTQKHLEVVLELDQKSDLEGAELQRAYKQMIRERAIDEGLEWPELGPEDRGAEGYYCVFPNMVFLVKQGALLGYRAVPNGSDPDSCIFDAYALELFPPGKAPEFKPEVFTNWRDGDVGQVLTQDFMNVEDVSVGLHSSSFIGATLSPLQEVPVFHRQVVLDEYLFGPAPGES